MEQTKVLFFLTLLKVYLTVCISGMDCRRSTGEEAYSLAIVKEARKYGKHRNLTLQILLI
jgi:hypothetical protein